MNKRGAEKYYIIMSLILGIIVLGLSLFYIFHEYFTEEDLDWEACRQSVVLRETIPRQELFFENLAAARDAFPLKCKTQVVEIDYNDTERAEKEILEIMRSCWYLFGEGESEFFPVTKFYKSSYCLPCARIHITPEVISDYKENPINFTKAFYSYNVPRTKMNYMDYFQRRKEGYSAFAYFADNPWNSTFTMKEYPKGIGQVVWDVAKFITLGPILGIITGGASENTLLMQLPTTWDVEESSDLLIIVYQTVYNYKDEDPKLQRNQVHLAYMTSNRLSETSKRGFYGWENKGSMCEIWEGIPA